MRAVDAAGALDRAAIRAATVERFDRATMVERYVDVYRSVLAERSAKSVRHPAPTISRRSVRSCRCGTVRPANRRFARCESPAWRAGSCSAHTGRPRGSTVDVVEDASPVLEGLGLRGLGRFAEEAHTDILDDGRARFGPSGAYSDTVRELLRDVREKAAEAGYYTMFVPEQVGGGGMGPVLLDEVWRHLHAALRRPGPDPALCRRGPLGNHSPSALFAPDGVRRGAVCPGSWPGRPRAASACPSRTRDRTPWR